ncbi:MAG TPA: hypothetical protein VHE30_05900 [Polyangiaceae bacterium]|nr:hypothetical protein [Polyangiaceae bacterium]
MREVAVYVARVRYFDRTDWAVYVAWVGLMVGLCVSTGGFLAIGALRGVRFPPEAWLVPAGAVVFTLSIAVDTIGHRTVYKEAIRGAEGLVHAITIFAGIGSCVLLCAAYEHRGAFAIPAMVLTALSMVYSLVDEAFHWRRYVSEHADRVEMWSHVGILVGHGTMMTAWWVWFFAGYPGVEATLARVLS